MELPDLSLGILPLEYAKQLHKRTTEDFDLVRANTNNQHQRQKEW